MVRRVDNLADAPLLAWGDALRAARERRRQRRRWIGIAAAGVALIGLGVSHPLGPRLVWNASASAPIGLYYVAPVFDIEPGDMVVAWPPHAVRQLAATRHYLPENVPLVKRVAGIGGDFVCATGDAVDIDGHRVAIRRAADGKGRPLPWWTGCIRLRGRQLFLLMAEHPTSFDGRYFGPTAPGDVVGRAWPLWVR